MVIFPSDQTLKGEKIMPENEENENLRDEGKPKQEESPSEKLEMNTPTGSLVPGAENPESKEIKEERSPNSE